MPKLHLTSSIVSNRQCPEGRRKIDLFDTDTKGLMLEIRATSGRTFYLRYTDKYGKTRQHRLADARDVTLKEARTLADTARNKVALGIDPSAEKAEARDIPTFRDYAYDQYMPYILTYKRSARCDEGLIRNHLIPRFGDRRLDDIHEVDMHKLVRERLNEGAAPGSVNRCTILLRYMFNLAIRDWKLPGVHVNPTCNVKKLAENNIKERYLSNEEVEQLAAAVKDSENTMLQFIVPFLLLTGARRNEVLHAEWCDIDMDLRQWVIPETKSGMARNVPLNDGALKILAQVADATANLKTDVIFPNPKTGKSYVSIYYSWDTARRKAGLPEVRLHDLRHSFASILINGGRSLYEVQKLLGHTQSKTTQRYAHLKAETLREASNVTSSVSNIFEGSCPSDMKGPQKRSVSVRSRLSKAYGPAIMQKGVKHRPVKNILAGMITEEQRIADEKWFIERFDYLESRGSRVAA